MGNGQTQDQNQRFNPNFNMAQYNQRMNQIRGQYSHQSASEAPGAYYGQRPNQQTMNLQQITRNVYIFKTSIEIHADANGKVRIQFQYHSPNPAKFDVGLGVRRIQQNQVTKEVSNIDCLRSFFDAMNPGEKVKFDRTYELDKNMMRELFTLGIMMKISCHNQYSEYSLGYIPNTKLWKVLVESYWREGKHFGIEDIYGGGDEGQQCIVCFTEKSTTMVKPCNHLCLCNECSKTLQKQSNSCPICRKKIASLVTIRTGNN